MTFTSAFAVLSLLLAGAPVTDAKPEKLRVYVGTGGSQGKGIYRFDLDLASGKLTPHGLVGEAVNPTFLAIHPNQRFLYAVGEVSNFQGKKTGGVAAFAIDAKTGGLTPLNQQSSEGAGPCHLVVDRAGKNVLVANYGGGNGCVLPIGPDGKLAPASAKYQHAGEVADKKRQGGPHAHSINLDAGNRFAFVADLGLDQVFVYRFDPEQGSLVKNEPPSVKLAPRSGPRHFSFHPNGKFAYVINEIDLTINTLAYDGDKGVLKTIQTVSTVPEGAERAGASTAELLVHPSGKFVYGSNRGHNSIAAFKVDPEKGTLTPAGHTSGPIKTPRNFGIDPTGRFLLVANQDGNSIVVYRINQQSGALEATGNVVEVPRPMCVKFVPAPQ